MAYTDPVVWVDGSGGATPITAAALNLRDNNIRDHQTRLTALETRPMLTVQSFGVTANTGTDQTAAFNTALAGASGRDLVVPRGNYRIDGQLNVTVNDVRLVCEAGAVIDASNATIGGTVLLVAGSQTTTSTLTPLSGTLVIGTRTCFYSPATGFAAGDYVVITSTEVFNPERPTQYLKGELNQVASVSGNQVTFANALVDSYSTSGNTVTMRRYSMVHRFSMVGGRIIGRGTGGQQTAIRCSATVDSRIEDVTVEDTERQGIVIETSVGGLITKCTARRINETALGYGFKANTGSRGVRLVGNHADSCRHGLEMDSAPPFPPCRDVTMTGNTVVNCTSSGISTHGGAENVVITGNTVDSCGGGIVNRCRAAVITGNVIIGGKLLAETTEAYRHGIFLAGDSSTQVGLGATDVTVANNDVRISAVYAGESVAGVYVSAPLVRSRIINNTLSGFSWHGIYIDAHLVADVHVSGNAIDCRTQAGTPGTTTVHGIYLTHATAAAGDHTENLIVESNIIRGALYSGIAIEGAFDTTTRSTAVRIGGNIVAAYGRNGVALDVGNYGRSVLVSGNIFPDTTSMGNLPPAATDAIYYVSARFLADPILTNNLVG